MKKALFEMEFITIIVCLILWVVFATTGNDFPLVVIPIMMAFIGVLFALCLLFEAFFNWFYKKFNL